MARLFNIPKGISNNPLWRAKCLGMEWRQYFPKYILWPLRVLMGIIVFALLALGAGIAWLSTDSGKTYTENIIISELSKSIGYTIAVKDMTFAFPLTARLSSFVLSDTQGVWLEADNVSIQLLPSPLIREHLIIQKLQTDSLRLLRTPETIASDGDNGSMDVSILEAQIKILSLDPLVTNLSQALEGNIDGSLDWDGNNERLTFDATSHVTQGLPEFEQGEIELRGNYALKEDAVTLESWKFTHPKLALTGKGMIQLNLETIDGTVKAEAINLAQWQASLQGIAAVDATLSGNFKHPTFAATINARELLYDTQTLPALAMQITGTSKENSWEGKIRVEGDKTIKGETLYVWSGKEVILNELRASYGENTAKGNLTINIDTWLAKGKLAASVPEIEAFASYLPVDMKGRADIDTTFTAPNNQQSAEMNIDLKNIDTPYGKASAAVMQTSFDNVFSRQPDMLQLRVSEGVYNDVQVHKAVLSAKRKNNGWQGDLAMEGTAQEPFNVAAASMLAPADDGWRMDIASLKGRYGALPLAAKLPVRVAFSGNAWSVKAPKMAIGDGSGSLDAALAEDTINISLKSEGIRLSTISADIPTELQSSRATVALSLKGDVSKPDGTADIQVSTIQIHPSAPPANLKTHATLNDGMLHIEGKLTNGKSATSDMTTSMPMQFSFMPFSLKIKDTAPLEGKVNLALDVAVFSKLLLPAGHALEGQAKGALALGGTYAKPSLSGDIKLRDGTYDYFDLGVKLRQIAANLTAQDSSIVLKDFHAEDTDGHALTGKGILNYSSKNTLHYRAEFDGNNLALFHHPNLQGALSGHIELTGDNASGQIKGKVQSTRTEIYLPSRFVSSVPELNVVSTIPPQKGGTPQTDSSTVYAIMLDVVLDAANQVFIRGWGVDAELQGNLHLTGTMANPEIAGKLTTLRGRYEEFGKQFKITQGELLFKGDIPPSPFLNITAATQAGDVEVRPILSGPLLTPSIKVESTPSLPQDEALSVLLFGKDSRKISPFQAVQLANSLRKLSGHGGSDFDPIGKIRKLVGVDDISVNSGGEDGTDTSVGVGKHLGENVYIGVERGADAASGKAHIEVEVTPSISVESGTGATGDTSVGVNWKHDY